MANREDSVFLAKLAEQSERYDEMYVSFLRTVGCAVFDFLELDLAKIANLQLVILTARFT
jgi:hypothetical protein